jgi:hypothetical protein
MRAAELVVVLPLLKRAMIATPIGRAALDAVLLAIQSHALGHMRVEEPSALGATVVDFFYSFAPFPEDSTQRSGSCNMYYSLHALF